RRRGVPAARHLAAARPATGDRTMTALLRPSGLAKSFRGVQAFAAVSFDVAESSITALIGPNGAGKTTVFNLIAGVHAPDAGTIEFGGRAIHGLRPEQVC